MSPNTAHISNICTTKNTSGPYLLTSTDITLVFEYRLANYKARMKLDITRQILALTLCLAMNKSVFTEANKMKKCLKFRFSGNKVCCDDVTLVKDNGILHLCPEIDDNSDCPKGASKLSKTCRQAMVTMLQNRPTTTPMYNVDPTETIQEPDTTTKALPQTEPKIQTTSPETEPQEPITTLPEETTVPERRTTVVVDDGYYDQEGVGGQNDFYNFGY